MPRLLALRRGVRAVAAVGILLLILLFAGVVASGAELPPSTCPPPAASLPAAPVLPIPAPGSSAEPAPEQVLVCVSPSQAITGTTYLHWLTVAKQALGPPAKGQRSPSASPTELRNEVLGFLISSAWVRGEAKDLSISVSAGKVRRNFDRVRSEQFPKRGEFKTFLRKSGQTVADLLFRVELNLLSERIQQHVVAGHHSAASSQRALMRFVKAFKAKWQVQTYCTPAYDVMDCGHVQNAV